MLPSAYQLFLLTRFIEILSKRSSVVSVACISHFGDVRMIRYAVDGDTLA